MSPWKQVLRSVIVNEVRFPDVSDHRCETGWVRERHLICLLHSALEALLLHRLIRTYPVTKSSDPIEGTHRLGHQPRTDKPRHECVSMWHTRTLGHASKMLQSSERPGPEKGF